MVIAASTLTITFACLSLISLVSLLGRHFLPALFSFGSHKQKQGQQQKTFKRFQCKYLLVYGLAVAGDWLQGPHVYALYESYKLSKHEIELLFIAGFGSSLVFGTFVGSIADKLGRKANCLLYALLYGICCLTKHSPSFYVLLFGRLLAGIATSILFSAFESWLICEHNLRQFNDKHLKQVFANATVANSLIAILAGLVAQQMASWFGYVAPFDVALLALLIMGVVCALCWTENYGDHKARFGASFLDALAAIRDDRRILCLGFVQSLFEGSMYVFVLEWTPALSRASHTHNIPHGYIFASFMLSITAGSSLFTPLCRRWRPEAFMRFVLLASAFVFVTPILFPNEPIAIFVAFNLFEFCVGITWPALGFLRSKYVAEKSRSTTMSFFRVPLNLLVICLLWQDLFIDVIFMLCFLSLIMSALLQQGLHSLTKRNTVTFLDGQTQKFSLVGSESEEDEEDEEEEVEKLLGRAHSDDKNSDKINKKLALQRKMLDGCKIGETTAEAKETEINAEYEQKKEEKATLFVAEEKLGGAVVDFVDVGGGGNKRGNESNG